VLRRFLLILIALALPVRAGAETPRELARRLLQEGNTLLAAGHCQGALERFTRAQEVFPSSYKTDVNLGTALECLRRFAEAITHYEQFLGRADPAADRDMITGVQEKLASLRAKVATVTVRGEAGAMVTVDGAEVGRTPLRRPIVLDPGAHRLSAIKGERRFSTELRLSTGERRELDALLPPVMSAPRRLVDIEPAPSPPRRRVWTWVTAGAAAAAAIVAIGVGASAKSNHDEYLTTNDLARFHDLESTITHKVWATNAMWGVAGALAVTSVVLFFVEGRPPREKKTSVSAGPGGLLLKTSF
jgi:tetratricopeptide (TPR) repeat protein